MDSRTRRARLVLKKQHHELDENLRVEMQKLGIRPVSKSRQDLTSATRHYIAGTDRWETEFHYSNGSKVTDTAFPVRKDQAKNSLMPALERHQKLGAMKGYSVKPTAAAMQSSNSTNMAVEPDNDLDKRSSLLETMHIRQFSLK